MIFSVGNGKLFVNVNTYQSPVNYVNINIPKDVWVFVAIVVRNNKGYETEIQPMYRKYNYVMDVYANTNIVSKSLSERSIDIPNDNLRSYKNEKIFITN